MDKDITLLVIEDDDVDLEMIQRALEGQNLTCPVVTAADGVEALEILRGSHASKGIHEPYIIVVDINMPRMDGFEFLTELRLDPDLADSVVFMFSSSDAPDEIERAYAMKVAGFVNKQDAGPKFFRLAEMIERYTMAIRLPGIRTLRSG